MRPRLAILLGFALSLAVSGYQFGQSNHTVYLLPALRQVHPELLSHDWFATQTLAYHTAFTQLDALLMRLHLIEPAFLFGYLLLILLLHIAWLRLVGALGGSPRSYLLSVALFYLSFGGTGLGFYQILQDSAFLPSNIANVALLWGLLFWITKRPITAALAFAFAALFHLNHAIIALPLWLALTLWDRTPLRQLLPGAAIILLAALPDLIPAALAVARSTPAMPLPEFINLYALLRHPHHYNPAAWPLALWLAFLWPIPLFIAVARRRTAPPWLQARRIYLLLLALQGLAILGAGLWYPSQTLLHLSLYRFSIYPLLLGCIAAAIALYIRCPRAAWLAPILLLGVATYDLYHRQLGLYPPARDDPAYLAVCHWARDNTPIDAVFLVPPQELSFRLHAQRAIVINFKGVPQLRSELPEWRDRLQTVLDLPDLRSLPTPMPRTLQAIADRYESLPPNHLARTARRYDARYLLLAHDLGPAWSPGLRHREGPYSLYDVTP